MTRGRRGRWKSDGRFFYPWERTFDRLKTPFEAFIEKESTSSMVLMACTILAIVIANSPFSEIYAYLVHIPLGVSIGEWTLERSALHWINEGCMAFFFFVVGLEIKREILVGELSDLKNAGLPIVAALGGMLVPALIYYGFNSKGEYAAGWGIPMTTDIAFCVGALVFLGKRIPHSLLIFLVSLAIVDDLAAVAVIAVFYTKAIHYGALVSAVAAFMILAVFNLGGVRRNVPYVFMGIILWLSMLFAGVDAAVSGALIALCIPAHGRYDPSIFGKRLRELTLEFDDACRAQECLLSNLEQQSVLRSIDLEHHLAEPPLQRMLDSFHLPVALIVIPLFALANAGITIDSNALLPVASHPVSRGIMCGLIIGKPTGIALFSWIFIRLKILTLPEGAAMRHVIGVGLLGGIGFTMSIFIAELSFGSQGDVLTIAKTSIVLSSLISGIIGIAWLWVASHHSG